MSERTGRCLCGSVRYSISAEAIVARVCWCKTCQKISGNGTANAIFPSAHVEVAGSLGCYVSKADSGNEIARHFCSTCGCHLFASSSANPAFRVVRLGTLDDPSSMAPQINMWSSSAPSWACLDPSLPSEPRQPALLQQTRTPPNAARLSARPDPMIDMSGPEDAPGALEVAWNDHDMAAFGGLFHHDASFVNRFGHYVRGAAGIVALHAPIHQTIYRDSSLQNELIEVTPIADGAAIVHCWSRLAAGVSHPAGPHVVDTLIQAVLTRKNAEWRIQALENVTLSNPRTGQATLRATNGN